MPGAEDKEKAATVPGAHSKGRGARERLSPRKNRGKRARGRQRVTYIDSILNYLGGGQTTGNVIGLARERRDWRSMVDNVTRQSLR